MSYDYSKMQFTNYLMKKHFSPRAHFNKRYFVIHHATIVGNGNGSALKTMWRVWQTRRASAHYGVDGKRIWQYVWDKNYAWSTGNTAGNEYGISVEHINSTGGPSWKVATTTWKTGAKLVAYGHKKYKFGRPSTKTIKRHKDFYNTACPGPYMDKIYYDYIKEAQRVYDKITGKKPKPKPTPKPKPKPKPTQKHLSDFSPSSFYIGARGKQITWLGTALVKHGFGGYYKVGPGPNFTEADRRAVAAFQRSQGWKGKDADGFPGTTSLKLLQASPKKKPKPKPKPKSTKYRVTASVLNGRSGPSTNYKVITQVKKGQTVTIASVKGKWGKSIYGTYFYMAYLKK